jgi:hypothetical protein
VDSSVSKGKFYTQLTVSSVLRVGGLLWYLASSIEFIHFLNLESHLKTHVLPTICSSKAIFNILKILIPFFPVLIKILCRHVVLLSMKFSRYVEFAVLKERFLIYVSLQKSWQILFLAKIWHCGK